MERELGNLHLAFQYAALQGATDRLSDLCEGMHLYYDMRTLGMEGETVFARAAEAYGVNRDRDQHVEAFLWIVAGSCGAWHQPDLAAERVARGMDMLQAEIPHGRLHALANTINATLSFGSDREANGRRMEGGIAFYREHGDRQGEALTLVAWAMVETYHDKALAEQLGQRSLQLHRDIEDRWGESLALHALARLAEASEKPELALSLYEEAWRLNEPFTRNAFGVISSILARARMEGQLGHVTISMQLAKHALELGQEGGYFFQAARAHLELGRANRAMGDIPSAKRHLTEAFSLLRYRRWSNLQGACAQLLVEVALDERDVSSARYWLHELSMLQPDNPALTGLRERLKR